MPLLHRLADWGHKHTTVNGKKAEPIQFVHTVCGKPMEDGEHCLSCDVTVPREHEAWIRPWRDPVMAPLAGPVASGGSVEFRDRPMHKTRAR